MCLEKLEEIGMASAAEWAAAMGYDYRASLNKVIKRILEKYPDKLKIHYRKPRIYEALIEE